MGEASRRPPPRLTAEVSGAPARRGLSSNTFSNPCLPSHPSSQWCRETVKNIQHMRCYMPCTHCQHCKSEALLTSISIVKLLTAFRRFSEYYTERIVLVVQESADEVAMLRADCSGCHYLPLNVNGNSKQTFCLLSSLFVKLGFLQFVSKIT